MILYFEGGKQNSANTVYRSDDHDPFASMASDDVFSDASIQNASKVSED